MEIKIDEVMVQNVLDQQASAGIKTAFEGYAVRSTIEKAISESVIPSLITTAIEEAASTINLKVLSQHLAEEIAKSVTRGVQAIIRETLVNIILDIKKIPEYEREKRQSEREKIIHAIFERESRDRA